MNTTFDPQTLADDLSEVERIYAGFFAGLDMTRWDIPVKGGAKEWTLHETVAHLVALNGAGLEGIQHALRGEPYAFIGLETRYDLIPYNRKGIDGLLDVPQKELCNRLLDILHESASVLRNLRPDQAQVTVSMPFYNRPLTVIEALAIIMVHTGYFHATQVAEPAGVSPLWMQLSHEIRHRSIGRVMRAFSLLYRQDIGGPLRTTIAFRIGGAGGGEWTVNLGPDAATSGEGVVGHPGLAIRMRDTGVFAKMVTGRLNVPLALIGGAMKLGGDLRLFPRMDVLFSVDARPKAVVADKQNLLPA